MVHSRGDKVRPRARSISVRVAVVVSVISAVVCVPSVVAAAPANDAFADAQVLTGTTATAIGSNVDATREEGEPPHHPSGSGFSVWYRWIAPEDFPVTVSLCDSDFDTVLAVYTGTSVNALTQIATNDDSFQCPVFQSQVTFDAVADTEYLIAVDGGFDETGAIALQLIDRRPPNDNHAGAIALTGFVDSIGAPIDNSTMEPGEPDFEGRATHSMWYRWTSPARGVATIDTCRSNFDTLLGVHQGGNVAALTTVAKNDNGCGRRQSRVVFFTPAGIEYRIQVAGVADSGRFRVKIGLPRPGLYSGGTSFPRKPFSFRLPASGTAVERITITSVLSCYQNGRYLGDIKLKDLVFRDPVPIGRGATGAAFVFAVRIRLRPRGLLTIIVEGNFIPPDRAAGKMKVTAELGNNVNCRNFFSPVRWTASRR